MFDIHDSVRVYDRAMGTALGLRVPSRLDVDRDLEPYEQTDPPRSNGPAAAGPLMAFWESDSVILLVATGAAYADSSHVPWIAESIDRLRPSVFICVSWYRLLCRGDGDVLVGALNRSGTWLVDNEDILIPDPRTGGTIQLLADEVAQPSAADRAHLIWSRPRFD